MKVLLIGESNKVTNAIVAKLNKEGHRVFVLTESKKNSYHNVYEKYYFEYGSYCIKDVFESVNPDLTIFAGAYDTAFKWERLHDEYLEYTTALNNMLTGYAGVGEHGRFVYLSSEEVYSSGEGIIEQIDMEDRFKARAVRQGETTCVNYCYSTGMDIIVLRIENLSYAPDNLSEVHDICANMCVDTLNENELHSGGGMAALLSLQDAVAFMYNIFVAENHRYNIYTIKSDNEIPESEIIDIVNRRFGFRVPVKYDIEAGPLWIEEFDVHNYSEEFPYEIYHPTAECADDTAQAVKKNSEAFIRHPKVQEKKILQILHKIKGMTVTFIPFIENLICFIPFFMINNRAVGNQFFGRLDSYLLYVLLFAIIYGQQQATFSAILAVAGYCFRQMYSKSGFEVAIDYNTYVWMAQLLIMGLAVGRLRDQLVLLRHDKDEEINYLHQRLTDIEKINISNVRLKKELEMQVVNQGDSMGKIYEIATSLDKYEPEEVLFYAADVVSRLMDSRDVAIYTATNSDYARLISFTSKKAKKLGNSIAYKQYDEMYTELAADRIFINKKMNQELPMMAMAIHSDGDIQLIVLVWDIPYEKMNLSQANRLKVIGLLTQNSVVRANRYMDILASQRYIEGTHILEANAFKSLVRAFLNARKKGLAECAFIKINLAGEDLITGGTRLEKYFRTTDYLGDMGDGYLYVMLVSTDNSGAAYVHTRLSEAGYEYTIPKEMNV